IKHLSKSVKVIIFLLVLISSAYAASWVLGYGQNNNSDGLVLDLTLSEENYNAATKTFGDQSGNNNNGVSFNNATFSVDKDGKSAGAMSFNGSSDYVNCGNNITDLALGENSFAMGAWAKVNQLSTSYNYLVSFGYPSSGHQAGFGIRNTGNLFLSAYSSPIVNTSYTVDDIYNWHYYFVVYESNSNQVMFYVDGVLREIEVINLDTIVGRCRVGSHVGDASFFNGEITNVQIFNRYFETEEVESLYNNYKPKLQASSLDKGLVGYWPLDGENYNANTNRVTDKSAYSNHGTNYGAILTEDRFGRSEGAVLFDSLDRITIPNKNQIYFNNNSNFTMSIWAKKTTNPVDGNVMGLFGTISGSNRFGIDYYFPGNQVRAGIRNSINGQQSFGANPLNDFSSWNHLVFVYESEKTNGMRLYINGNLANAVSNIGFADFSSSADYWLGSNFELGGTAKYFLGSLAEARIYNRALSDEEIKSLYEKDAPKISSSSLKKGLVLDMPLTSQYTKGGATGSEILVDISPYGHNGQNYGAILNENDVTFGSDLEPLLMDYRVWKDGQSGPVGSFSTYSVGNSRIIEEDPWGRKVVVWKSVPNAGIYHNAQTIDNTKLYRMSWWEKRVTNAAATYAKYYAGLNGYGSVNGVRNLNGTYNTNPYFWNTNHSNLTEGQWFLVVGHVFPYTHTGTDRHPDSGRYTVDGFIGHTSADYKWAPETVTARSRTLSVYQGDDPGVVHYTIYPRMDVVDGTEPSIQELLNGHDSYGNDIVVTVPEEKVSVSFWYNDVESNGWVHVVNSSGTFYVNGELGNPDKYPVVINDDQVYIGRTTMSDYFIGSLSHLKIYNRVLSATEVKSLYDQGRGETAIILGGN
ncbi:MAG: LamG-like jellyroll fold domain-containing protein, partial [Patescibacteria group bacterium]|nr:LamG-like jellyroll fold domain-containing protein [Patescibacteria group bacterium]